MQDRTSDIPRPTETAVEPSADRGTMEVTRDVHGLRTGIVNVFFVGMPGTRDWLLVDAGMQGTAPRIIRTARKLYGDAPPRAIILTHGHFDHVGALHAVLAQWPDVRVYVHDMERPYLDGRSAYPPPDPTVGGGAVAEMSRMFPRGPWNFAEHLEPLPADGSVPFAPEWRWVETPGHSPGHVSFFRESDRTLIAGDAVVTTKQESIFAAITQRVELHGPPMYFTADWAAARDSVLRLVALEPSALATGHGRPMRGPRMRAELNRLAANFERLAMPKHGRYVPEPAIADLNGVVSVPPAVPDVMPRVLMGAAAAVVVGLAARQIIRSRSEEGL